jgi:uncharacterized membrane protein YdjX (TVP38/TMEM64 family)
MPEIIQSYLEVHIALAPVISIVVRVVSIILAPVPGTPIDLINISFFGKGLGFLYAEISIMLGSSINFWIARYFKESAVRNFISLEKIEVWEKRISEKSGFLGLVLIRTITAPIFDYISYVLGLSKMSFRKFFAISFIASAPTAALFYYLGGTFLEDRFFLAIAMIVPLSIFYQLFQQGKIFKRFSDYINAR